MASMYQFKNLALAARSLCASRDMKTPTNTSRALLLAWAFFNVDMNRARSCCSAPTPQF